MSPPADWPSAGPIDLGVHDLPHRSSATEWWYVNSHFRTEDGRSLSLFAAFFRIINGRDDATGAPKYAHSITWALSDSAQRRYVAESRVDESAPAIGLERIRRGRGSKDPRLNRAMSEILERGHVPSPDRAFDGPVTVSLDRLALDFAGARFEKLADGAYQLRLSSAARGLSCDLVFHPERAPVRHGDDGLVRGHGGEEMFYYFIPRCRLTGSITTDGKTVALASGQGWYDHEFGGPSDKPAENSTASDRVDIAWNWAAVQLDGGGEISAYALVRVSDGKPLYRWAVAIDRRGQITKYDDFELAPSAWWRSTRTFHNYPVAWRLSIPAASIELTLRASFDDQEFLTVLSKPAFWEGRTEVHGAIAGDAVSGLGYIERSGFEPIKDLEDFFSAVGDEVRESVRRVVPLDGTREQSLKLAASEERPHYLDGVDLSQLSRALFAPIREIADRGGKSWRSYAALACCDVVGGDSRKFVQWLAMPELLHVGSLIVDDVQDRSTVRRGGPSCHAVYGDALAINAGTAAYFLTQRLLITDAVTGAQKLRLYDLYFEAMRAGHAGQALDLSGLAQMMPSVLETGATEALERSILATHRLKTAAPASALARMGAVAGGGSDAQIEGVGKIFEALGLAFQIVDDVLNLRGFRGNLKTAGEDISNGVITLPVAKALAKLPEAERRSLWQTLSSKPQSAAVVGKVIALIESTGALNDCEREASERIEDAWRTHESLFEDSLSKLMLRAFGWYVLERHY